MAKATIGLPRALLYHKNRLLWPEFFRALGHEVVVSPPTNRLLLERGVSHAIDESCLPLKIYLGHVEWLASRCDKVLVQRVESLRKRETCCVKFLATYDIVRNAIPEADVLEYTLDIPKGLTEKRELVRLGRALGAGAWEARTAHRKARRAQDAADAADARKQRETLEAGDGRLKILLASHAYNSHDALLGEPIARYLASLDVDVVYAEAAEPRTARRLAERMSPSLYWTYNKEILGAVLEMRDRLDGVIFLVTFPCGPDSLVTELCHRKIEGLPLASVVLDELQAEAGLRTRLESFVDVIRMRKRAAAS